MDKNQVNTAFGILVEEIEKIFDVIRKDIEDATKLRDFDKVKSLTEKGKKLQAFGENVKNLQKEWRTIFSEGILTKGHKKQSENRLKWGLKTHQKEFCIPILESLIELGGKAKMKEVLKLVHDKMKNTLNKYDYEPPPSDPKQTRWKNSAQWARNTMVDKGLLSSKSPKGVWEITEEGRKFYNQNKNKIKEDIV